MVTCSSTSSSSLSISLAAPLKPSGPDTTTRHGGGIRPTDSAKSSGLSRERTVESKFFQQTRLFGDLCRARARARCQ